MESRDSTPETVERSTSPTGAFLDARRRQLLGRLRFAIPLTLGVIAMDWIVQWATGGPLFERLFTTRLTAMLVLGVLAALAYAPRAERRAFVLSLATLLVIVADVESAILASGGYGSRFQTGLALVPVAVALLLPYSLGQMIAAAAIVWTVYLLPLAAGTEAAIASFAIDGFFLAVACGLAIATSWLTTRLSYREFTRSIELQDEQRRSEGLLRSILPAAIADRLKRDGRAIAERHGEVTVLFADIAGFTPLSERMNAERLVALLNELVSEFDDLAEKHGAEKIKTVGDAYLAVAGLPEARLDHADVMADLALDMLAGFKAFAARHELDLGLRIGLHAGPVVAGVIGRRKFAYDLWGDTVNTASRMESSGQPGRIQITGAVRERLRRRYDVEPRGAIPVKGKGDMPTWYLLGHAAHPHPLTPPAPGGTDRAGGASSGDASSFR